MRRRALIRDAATVNVMRHAPQYYPGLKPLASQFPATVSLPMNSFSRNAISVSSITFAKADLGKFRHSDDLP
jgi:hypothetical protein